MRYFLAHLDDAPGEGWRESDPAEEIYVIPYDSRLATAVPIGALRRLLPLLHEATIGRPTATCAGCGSELPAGRPRHDLAGTAGASRHAPTIDA
jgi:hypothetical protein